MEKRLAAFDFDHTIIEDNSDIAVLNLLDRKSIPKELSSLRKWDGWTAYMQEIFKLLNKHKRTESDIHNVVINLEPVKGMVELINTLYKENFDIIIISDSNSYFIDTWLAHYKLKNKIKKVFTNPARFDSNGLLKITGYHYQTSCKLSTKNLCKGQILNNFLEHQRKKHNVEYFQTIYCGDGKNDFCPILRLRPHDLAFAREKYKLVDVIEESKTGKIKDDNDQLYQIKCNIFIWNNGLEIYSKINEMEII